MVQPAAHRSEAKQNSRNIKKAKQTKPSQHVTAMSYPCAGKILLSATTKNAKQTIAMQHLTAMSYPCAGATGPLNWSHHDKLVCVDRETVFLGGLDLGFGRYDTPAHALTDRCHLHCTWPGKDYYNPAVTPLRMFGVALHP
jgi:hypothetical protein